MSARDCASVAATATLPASNAAAAAMRCRRPRLSRNIGAYHSRTHITFRITQRPLFLRYYSRPMHSRSLRVRTAVAGLAVVVAACSTNGGSRGPSDEAWREVNQRVVDEHKVSGREREVPDVTVP